MIDIDYPSATSFLYDIPFGERGELFYNNFYSIAGSFLETPPDEWDTLIPLVNRHFNDQFSIFQNRTDPHLNEGIYANLRRYAAGDNDEKTRVFLVLSNIFKESISAESQAILNTKNTQNTPRGLLPSPLYFLRTFLTSPEFPASEAYAQALVRALVFGAAVRYYEKTKIEKGLAYLERTSGLPEASSPVGIIRHFISFELIVDSLRAIQRHRRIRDTFYPANPTDFIVAHMLASHGLMHLSFPSVLDPDGAEPKRSGRQELRGEFLSRGSLIGEDALYEFKLSPNVESLPPAAEFVNEVDGLPIAIPNADIIFARGLRFTSSEGTVIRVAGPSGSGKTSFALGLATALAPLGIDTIYLSCEENSDDLERRISTLVPEFIRRTSTYQSYTKIGDWFKARHLNQDPDTDVRAINRLIDDLVKLHNSSTIDVSRRPPGLTPLLIVLDGIHELLTTDRTDASRGQETRRLRTLVENLRRTGALILVMSADHSDPAVSDLDYVVDIVADIAVEKSDELSQPLLRKFILKKTRRQFARMGAHLMHLSPKQGVALTPQISAQRDMHRDFAWVERSSEAWFDVFRKGSLHSSENSFVIKLYEYSQVLVTGQGSSGKSSFALRLVSGAIVEPYSSAFHYTPDLFLAKESKSQRIANARSTRIKLERSRSERRVLIISFLYQSTFYENLCERINSLGKSVSDTSVLIPSVEFFYPGHLRPEDFLRRVVSAIEVSHLEGQPFEVVVIDGLHNVFMQFPSLQQGSVLWPILYEMLRRFRVTVVTTHTHMDMPGSDSSAQMAFDLSVARERSAPVLQALVNAADYYFDISPSADSRNKFRIKIANASDQPIPADMVWDKTHLTISYS